MRSPQSVLLVLLVIVLAVPTLAADIKDHEAISRYPGSTPTRRDDDGFRSYVLVTGVNPQGKTDADALTVLNVEGDVTRLAYENPKDRSAHEIFANYREALEKGGFKVLFACSGTECGPGFASSRWGRVTGLRYTTPDMRYLAAQSTVGDRPRYVAVLVAKLRHQVEVVESTAMETGLVTAKALSDGLARDGRVVLDGVHFDTDETSIRSDSKPALDVIASFLRENPAMQVHIVGHTDGVGAFEHNMNLSKGRAAAVAAALNRDYGIDAKRMTAHGVGPLVPESTNQSEGGRSRNRRVEMVQR
jgi:OOP family OmpA-OmpF porin